MKTNRTNWIKLPEHETESFTHTLRCFTLLGRSWFGQYIFLKVMHYRNFVLYTALLLTDFHSSAMQISFHLMRIWGNNSEKREFGDFVIFGAESEFIIAAQTFSSLRIVKCGLELTITIHWTYFIWSYYAFLLKTRFHRFCTTPRFEKEAQDNSEMAYCDYKMNFLPTNVSSNSLSIRERGNFFCVGPFW